MKLTPAERLILSNLFELRALLEERRGEHWKNMSEIVLRGYEVLFGDLPPLDRPVPHERGRFLFDVLDLFRLVDDYIQANPNDGEIGDHAWARFRGFDGVTERDLLGLCAFVVGKQGKWAEQATGAAASEGFDSRAPSVKRYEKMLAAWHARGAPSELSRDDVRAILEPKPKKKHKEKRSR